MSKLWMNCISGLSVLHCPRSMLGTRYILVGPYITFCDDSHCDQLILSSEQWVLVAVWLTSDICPLYNYNTSLLSQSNSLTCHMLLILSANYLLYYHPDVNRQLQWACKVNDLIYAYIRHHTFAVFNSTMSSNSFTVQSNMRISFVK